MAVEGSGGQGSGVGVDGIARAEFWCDVAANAAAARLAAARQLVDSVNL